MKMQMFVNVCPFLDDEEETKTLTVDSDDTVYDVMAQIESSTGVPPVMQRITFRSERFYHDTPGTLAENGLVDPSAPDQPSSVHVSKLDETKLKRKTLVDLGFPVYVAALPDYLYVLRQSRTNTTGGGPKRTLIAVTDHIRMDGGNRRLLLLVAPDDTVATLMDHVLRTRRYPVAMQQLWVRSAGEDADARRKMGRLDATMADYGVTKDSQIDLYMDMRFALRADWERRNGDKSMPTRKMVLGDRLRLPLEGTMREGWYV